MTLLYILATIGALDIIAIIIFFIILAIDTYKWKDYEYIEGYGLKKKIPENNLNNQVSQVVKKNE